MIYCEEFHCNRGRSTWFRCSERSMGLLACWNLPLCSDAPFQLMAPYMSTLAHNWYSWHVPPPHSIHQNHHQVSQVQSPGHLLSWFTAPNLTCAPQGQIPLISTTALPSECFLTSNGSPLPTRALAPTLRLGIKSEHHLL